MEIQNVPLPEDIVQGAAAARGNFATRNASYRRAVCSHLGLQWRSINGAGNCFFAAVSTCLLATLPSDRTNHLVGENRLRALVVEWLEQQMRLEDDLAERVQVEIDAELNVRSNACLLCWICWDSMMYITSHIIFSGSLAMFKTRITLDRPHSHYACTIPQSSCSWWCVDSRLSLAESRIDNRLGSCRSGHIRIRQCRLLWSSRCNNLSL